MRARQSLSISEFQAANSSAGRRGANRRRLEIPFLNGLIADKEVGVATPAHDNVVALTHAIEKGELKPSKALLDQMLG